MGKNKGDTDFPDLKKGAILVRGDHAHEVIQYAAKNQGNDNGHPSIVAIPLVDEFPKSSDKDKSQNRSRTWKLVAVILVIVISWFLVTVWADVFEIFLHRVLRIPKHKFFLNLCVAIAITLILVWFLLLCNIDDLVSS